MLPGSCCLLVRQIATLLLGAGELARAGGQLVALHSQLLLGLGMALGRCVTGGLQGLHLLHRLL